jgi:hypothetical protein
MTEPTLQELVNQIVKDFDRTERPLSHALSSKILLEMHMQTQRLWASIYEKLCAIDSRHCAELAMNSKPK